MFIGSINRYMRCVLESAAGQWKGLPVYVACSGNFTVERILAGCGVAEIHSNDVSIYSCALGWHLANTPRRFVIKAQDYSWLGPYLDPGPATIATLLLAGEMLKVGGDPSTPSTGCSGNNQTDRQQTLAIRRPLCYNPVFLRFL